MKTAIFVLIAVGTVLVAGDDFKKSPAPHQDANHHGTNGQQHPAGAQHQLKQQQQQQPQNHYHQAAPATQQHQVKQQPEQHKQSQPQQHQHHKRETPKQDNAAAQSSTAAPKATVDPKQPAPLPAIVSQAPKGKRDTVAANPAKARPSTSAPVKSATGGNQQRKNQPRPTGAAKVNRDQPKVPLQVPQTSANAKAPAAAPVPTTANPAKKL